MPPYSDIHGELLHNATINFYTYCTIEETSKNIIEICSYDSLFYKSYDSMTELTIDGEVSLLKGAYNRIV